MIAAFLLGLVMGFLGSIPTAGPVGMLVVARGLMGRPKTGFLVATGSTFAEMFYAFVAFWGFAAVMARFPHLTLAARVLPCVTFAALGLYLAVGANIAKNPTPARERGRKRTVLLGFGMTAVNPTLLVTWGAAAGVAHSTGLPATTVPGAILFALGAGAGGLAWFAVLLWLLARIRMRAPSLRLVLSATVGAV